MRMALRGSGARGDDGRRRRRPAAAQRRSCNARRRPRSRGDFALQPGHQVARALFRAHRRRAALEGRRTSGSGAASAGLSCSSGRTRRATSARWRADAQLRPHRPARRRAGRRGWRGAEAVTNMGVAARGGALRRPEAATDDLQPCRDDGAHARRRRRHGARGGGAAAAARAARVGLLRHRKNGLSNDELRCARAGTIGRAFSASTRAGRPPSPPSGAADAAAGAADVMRTRRRGDAAATLAPRL